jgi:hypothetical protein
LRSARNEVPCYCKVSKYIACWVRVTSSEAVMFSTSNTNNSYSWSQNGGPHWYSNWHGYSQPESEVAVNTKSVSPCSISQRIKCWRLIFKAAATLSLRDIGCSIIVGIGGPDAVIVVVLHQQW